MHKIYILITTHTDHSTVGSVLLGILWHD